MCNIAGYIGKREAAPILIEMMRREEGYAGGFYTGITVHDGTRLNTVKTVGPLEALLKETNAATFRGTCGFIHSRSNSGGDRKWGQPFITADGGTFLIANGFGGRFRTPERFLKQREAILSLERDGYTFSSRMDGAVENYPTLVQISGNELAQKMLETAEKVRLTVVVEQERVVIRENM